MEKKVKYLWAKDSWTRKHVMARFNFGYFYSANNFPEILADLNGVFFFHRKTYEKFKNAITRSRFQLHFLYLNRKFCTIDQLIRLLRKLFDIASSIFFPIQHFIYFTIPSVCTMLKWWISSKMID